MVPTLRSKYSASREVFSKTQKLYGGSMFKFQNRLTTKSDEKSGGPVAEKLADDGKEEDEPLPPELEPYIEPE